jgi:CRP-like cAMP-binding protein
MRADSRRIGSVERLLHFKKIPALAGLEGRDLAALAEHARERFFPEGSLLLRDGEPCPAAHFIVEGRVRMRRQGRDLGEVGIGSGVGGLSILARDENGLEAQAITDTVTLELETDAFLEVLEDHFGILRHLLQEIARQLIDLIVRTPRLEPRVPPAHIAVKRDLDFVERIFVLRQAAPFARSSINALAELARGMTELRFEPDVVLWEVGEPSRTLYLVLDGEVSCTAPDGRVLFQVGPGSPVGAIESVAGVPRWFRTTTVTPVSALSADAEGLLDVLEDNFEMGFDYLATLARWLMVLLERRATLGDNALGPFYLPEVPPAAEDRP